MLFPPLCGWCSELTRRRADELLCRSCEAALLATTHGFAEACLRCGHPGWGDHCPRCSAGDRGDKNTQRLLDGVIAWGRYHGLLRDVIVAGKYPSRGVLSREIARRLGRRIRQDQTAGRLPSWDLVTHVPNRPWRRIRRGGNAVRLLSEAIGTALGTPTRGVVSAMRGLQKQAWLDDEARRINVAGAFAVRRGASLAGQRVLVVDDVMTTGATAEEIAAVLKAAGAESVWLAVLARAVRDA